MESAIEMQIAAGRLVNRPPTEEEREQFGHSPRVTHVLDLGRAT